MAVYEVEIARAPTRSTKFMVEATDKNDANEKR